MKEYCLEFGSADEDYVIVHKLSCEHFDHATLLGLGRLQALGIFDTSFAALSMAQKKHQDAVRCLDCCSPDLVPYFRAECNTRSNPALPMRE
jgi:hypothetical protein